MSITEIVEVLHIDKYAESNDEADQEKYTKILEATRKEHEDREKEKGSNEKPRPYPEWRNPLDLVLQKSEPECEPLKI